MLKRILALDGGGLRGIIPGMVLVKLEELLQKKTGKPNTRIAEYFDLIAGTSTGGILTCALTYPGSNGKPKYSASEVVDLYLKYGKKIFSKTITHSIKSVFGLYSNKYLAANLEEVLEQYFGEANLSELIVPTLITAFDLSNNQAKFFTSHTAKTSVGDDFKVKHVARATSAAPTYFPPAVVPNICGDKFCFIDGGVFANNPALCAAVEAVKLNNDGVINVSDVQILSIGTGIIDKKIKLNEPAGWTAISWVKTLVDIATDSQKKVTEYQLERILAPKITRIDITYSGEGHDIAPEMDDASDKTIALLKQLGTDLAKSKEEELQRIVDIIA